MSMVLIRARYKYRSFWKCELKPSEHAYKIFFLYSKLCAISLFAKRTHYLPPKHASRRNSRNIVGMNLSMVIPLLANQDLTSMLFQELSVEIFVAFHVQRFNQIHTAHEEPLTLHIRPQKRDMWHKRHEVYQ